VHALAVRRVGFDDKGAVDSGPNRVEDPDDVAGHRLLVGVPGVQSIEGADEQDVGLMGDHPLV
jgi:hypothetical protein